MDKKPRVLLLWFDMPDRPELLKPFAEISDDVDIVLLKTNRSEEAYNYKGRFTYAYFFDHLTPYELLKKVRPDKIILANNDSIHTIALNIAGKNKGIPTYAMQHGYILDNIENIFITNSNRKINFKTFKHYFRILLFYLSAFQLRNMKYLFHFLKLPYCILKYGQVGGTNRCKFRLRNSDFYICYTYKSGNYFKQRDKIDDSRILQIGLPQYDSYFKTMLSEPQYTSEVDSNYYLLIDTSFKEYNRRISNEDIIRCYTELAKYCSRQNAVLYIKLHPYNYNDDLVKRKYYNIHFVMNVESSKMNQLIKNAKGCFSFYSTMIYPIVCIKKCYQIKYGEVYSKTLSDSGIVKDLDFFTFTADNIDFESFAVNKAAVKNLIKENLLSTDGKSVERLKLVLTSAL